MNNIQFRHFHRLYSVNLLHQLSVILMVIERARLFFLHLMVISISGKISIAGSHSTYFNGPIPSRLSTHWLIQHYSMSPHMAIDSLQYPHVVWKFNNLIDTMGIMYTKLDTLGNFGIPPMPVVYPPYSSGGGSACIAVDRSNRLHLVWVDGRIDPPNTADIFYKRGENEQTVWEL